MLALIRIVSADPGRHSMHTAFHGQNDGSALQEASDDLLPASGQQP